MGNIDNEYQIYEQEQPQQESGGLPGVLELIIGARLVNFVYANNLGWVFGADTDFVMPGFEKPKQPDVALPNP